jgi:hypothetical protein
LFKTQYNQHFTYEKTINKLSDINIDGNNILIDINKNEKLITDGGIL